ncbi:hypothetical protein [Parabacteroides distasonis]|uniref:hypothetical protein n=1 Tax=Parabacteroides distasonis TaxID=823 RepID=UPI00325C3365
MAKVDFKNLRVQAKIEGDPIIVDTRKELGNLVWGAARDIAVSDFGKEIYFSDGPIEVGEETAKEILSILDISSASAPLRRALIEALTPKRLPAKKGK